MSKMELDDLIKRAEKLSPDQKLHLIVHLAKQGKEHDLASKARLSLDFVEPIRISYQGFVDEETFTPTWAYDQIWSSLRAYSIRQPGGRDAFRFHQTGRKSLGDDYAFSIDGFEFGPKDDKPLFAMRMRDYSEHGQEADQTIRSEIMAFFEAGAQVVWDVDVFDDKVIHVYRATNPDHPT